MAIFIASAPAGPSRSEYRPDMSVMKPMRITSPENWAWAGLAPNIAATAKVQAAESFFSFITVSIE